MYCGQCGSEMPNTAAFCARCGHRMGEAGQDQGLSPLSGDLGVAAQNASRNVVSNELRTLDSEQAAPVEAHAAQEQPAADHPYKKLGGFLAFIVYAYYVMAGLTVIAPIVSIIQLVSLSSQYGAYGSSIVAAAMGPLILLLLLYIALAIIMCWWAGMLKRRNPSFLKIMHYFGGVSIAIMLVYGLVTGNANGSLLYALIGALSLFLWTLYYVKSVRVRTYFGSDEYLRQSPFTKNIQGPTPAVPD